VVASSGGDRKEPTVAAIVQIVQIEEIEAPVPKVLTLAVLVRRLEIEALGPNDR
jgi:hypothetical protein